MRDLRLVAVSDAGDVLVLADGEGVEFRLPVDDAVRASLRRDRQRPGQAPSARDAALRPADVQARIRAGESAEEIAAGAGVPVEKVRRYEGPILREREWMAAEARETPIRRAGGDADVPVLGEVVARRLEAGGLGAEDAAWDAWRREDGTWQVRLGYRAGDGERQAMWVFDPRRRTVTPSDQAARVLSGERVAPAGAAAAARRPQRQPGPQDDVYDVEADGGLPERPPDLDEVLPGEALPGEALPVDALPFDGADEPAVPVAPVLTLAPAAAETVPSEPDVPEPDVPEPDVPEPDVPEPDVPEPDVPDPAEPAAADPPARPRPTTPRLAGSRAVKRPSVPSWDDIVFGSRRQD